jgi:hypothetical protein
MSRAKANKKIPNSPASKDVKTRIQYLRICKIHLCTFDRCCAQAQLNLRSLGLNRVHTTEGYLKCCSQ